LLLIVKTALVFSGVFGSCDLVINATPLGLKEEDPSPLPVEALNERAIVYDLVYAKETKLVKAAKKRGIKAANGRDMLINQGALSFEIWTGKPYEEVRKVMEKVVNEQLDRS
jgi:shikimate 5-dehydrogenase